MKISGIICEYNPFHNGHLYHIRETRKNGATHIVVVMSGNFVQRGDVAVMDKLTRARLAVRSGADLVIELPVQYCLSCAENFASGAVWLLHCLGAVEELSFGSECGDIEKLRKALDTVQLAAVSRQQEIEKIMKMGYTYPRAINSVVSGIDPRIANIINSPNNMLAIEYIRALNKFASHIEPFTVKRSGSEHDSAQPVQEFASASFIRENLLLKTGNFPLSRYTTPIWAESIKEASESGRMASMRKLERIILYKLRTSSAEEMSLVSNVAQGFENRMYSARTSSSLEELLYRLKTKRYTMARIRRILLSLLIGIRQSDMEHLPPYGRILAFNDRGAEILAKAKRYALMSYAPSLSKLSEANDVCRRFAQLEEKASDVYGLALDSISSAQEDIRAKIMLDME